MSAAPMHMSMLPMLIKLVEKEFQQHRLQDRLLKPMLSWFLKQLLPYACLFIGLNFFLTVIAVTLVSYVAHRRSL